MLKHFPKNTLGYANHGWLKSNHHFSFANYYNPQRMGFGALRVVNDDDIMPDQGFPAHPHKNMEIITYVRTGAITHGDNMGNKGVTKAGDVQVMSAGSGVVHSEYNLSKSPVTLYQIWIESKVNNVQPRWETKPFPKKAVTNTLPLVVSGFEEDKDTALAIYQDARIYAGRLKQGTEIEQVITQQAYILASDGHFSIFTDNPKEKLNLQKGDGAEVTHTSRLYIKANTDCELLIIDVPS